MGATLLAHVLYGLPGLWSAVLGRAVVTLHNGDDFSIHDDAPKLDRLRNPRLVTQGGATPVKVLESEGGGVAAHFGGLDGPGWFVVETEPAFIELEASEFESYLEHEGLRSVVEARREANALGRTGREIYSKYAKVALDARRGFVSGAVGFPIEIIPVSDEPCAPGDAMRVRVLLRGHGASGLQLRATHRASEDPAPRVASTQVTLAGGEGTIHIDQPGLWRLHTIAIEPHTDPATADWRSHWASLTFRV